MTVTIYHNPRCSKSRQTLALIEDKGITPEVVRYLDSPPSKAELKRIIGLLGCSVHDLIRSGESEYRELGLSKDTPDSTLIDAMVSHPRLIQRPIVIHDGQARLGRPPEQVLEILE
ncbi:arsenate reductase (glutaredoxin) [Wenzhouxiangella marina]|uniref:Arsenate reductase n=1 Tax=Wenzhouxiangella marina TaxID=1579979 RepID=A0A0K0XSW1_9GAMM|nr:arsenate reductase (glutaredoxin) [Wenzhouxiangella marina]AKS40804.1 arsenate reductase [Wenzhouxiangella marina]MBB6087678.1 arsenate reductase [Wenzhouxiangella marina]